jgi:hypothetical protein
MRPTLFGVDEYFIALRTYPLDVSGNNLFAPHPVDALSRLCHRNNARADQSHARTNRSDAGDKCFLTHKLLHLTRKMEKFRIHGVFVT